MRPTEGQLSFSAAERIWCRERSRDPVEIQAERFASYLLMPTDLLKPRIPPNPWRGWRVVRDLAAHFGASPTAMIVRLEVGGGLIATVTVFRDPGESRRILLNWRCLGKASP